MKTPDLTGSRKRVAFSLILIRPLIEKAGEQGPGENLMIYPAIYESGGSLYNRGREHILGRNLLNFGLMKEYGRTWEVGQEAGPKLCLKGAEDVEFNISYTRGLVVCVVADRALGVDTECIRPFREGLTRRVCSELERGFALEGRSEAARQERFFRPWTLKESFIKVIGRGLAFPLGNITFSLEEGAVKGSVPDWRFYQSRVCQSYTIPVCTADEETVFAFTTRKLKVEGSLEKASMLQKFVQAEVSRRQTHVQRRETGQSMAKE